MDHGPSAVAAGAAALHPGRMNGYGQFCPVAQALEVVGERWTLLVVRELLHGNYRFGEILNGVPLMSRSLLSRRLKEMEISNLIARVPQGRGHVYRLTEAGNALRPLINQLAEWFGIPPERSREILDQLEDDGDEDDEDDAVTNRPPPAG